MAVLTLPRRDPLDVRHTLATYARAGVAMACRREPPSPAVRHRIRAVAAWCALIETGALGGVGWALSTAVLLAAIAVLAAAALFAAGWLVRDRSARREAARHAATLDGLAEVAHAQRLYVAHVAAAQASLHERRCLR